MPVSQTSPRILAFGDNVVDCYRDQRRMFPDGGFRNDFGTDRFLRDEPRNVWLTKLTYLFSI